MITKFVTPKREDGWRLNISVLSSNDNLPPVISLRSEHRENNGGSRNLIRFEELEALEAAIVYLRSLSTKDPL
jgi:hypothetical protein